MKALQFYLKKINERPDKYKIVRTTKDIDEAIAEKKLGLYFTHQGTGLFEGDVDNVAIWRQLGYGYCLLAYNLRNPVGDGCFMKENGGLTAYGKTLIDAYNRYGMLVDVSHTGERTALDAIERSSQPVISSHSVAMAIAKYQRSLEDSVIKGVAQSGGVCSINSVGAFVDMSNPDIVTTDMLFKHIDYMVNLVGIDHVGYGSDFIPDITFTADGMQTPFGRQFSRMEAIQVKWVKKDSQQLLRIRFFLLLWISCLRRDIPKKIVPKLLVVIITGFSNKFGNK